MSYHLEPFETIPGGIRRIAVEQVDKAMDNLARYRSPAEIDREAIGRARVRFKRIRAVLRLVRYEIGAKVYHTENACLRDAGRRLSVLRDSVVVFQTLDQLIEQNPDPDATRSALEFRRVLTSAWAPRVAIEAHVIARVERTIRPVRWRATEWPVQRNDFGAFRTGLERVYGDTAKALARALADPTEARFHALRKQAGYLRAQFLILKRMQGDRQFSAELKELEGYLSEDHDLAVLARWFRAVMEKSGNGTVEPLLALIQRRRIELESKAKPLGSKLLSEEPAHFSGRLEEDFNRWRADSQPDAQEICRRTFASRYCSAGVDPFSLRLVDD